MIKLLRDFFKKPKEATKVRGYWVIKRTKNKEWYFVLKAGNHQTLLTSETYHNRGDALRGIDSIRRNASGIIKE